MTPVMSQQLRDLVEERERTAERIAALSRDLAAIVEATTAVATDDEHDPEGATIAFERAQVQALLAQARGRHADLEQGIERVNDGTYDACERCGEPIGADRLAARPGARTCIGCAASQPRRL